MVSLVYNHPQKLWHKPPSPSFNVDFLSFRPARCTRQPSEQAYFLRKKGVIPQYFVTV